MTVTNTSGRVRCTGHLRREGTRGDAAGSLPLSGPHAEARRDPSPITRTGPRPKVPLSSRNGTRAGRVSGGEVTAARLQGWSTPGSTLVPCRPPSRSGSPGSLPTSARRPPRHRGRSSASPRPGAARRQRSSPGSPGSWRPGSTRRRSRRSPSTPGLPRSCGSGSARRWSRSGHPRSRRPRSCRPAARRPPPRRPGGPSACGPSTPSASRSFAMPGMRRTSSRESGCCGGSSPTPTPPPGVASTMRSPGSSWTSA